MSFAGIFNGSFVVWHENIAQIDIKLGPQLSAFNKMDLIVGLNRFNDNPQIKIYYKSSINGTLVYLTQLAPSSLPTIPGDGSFVEATYSASFNSRIATDIRVVVTKDGINPQEFTPIKKYTLYNNSIATVGGSQFKVNDLGWQTGEVFRTIFKYLEAPISSVHTIDLETETSGLLPEIRIRNDNLLARVADNEAITGIWSFEQGQIIVETGTVLPTNTPINAGRMFYNVSTGYLYVGDGAWWIRLIQEDELARKPDFAWGFTRPARVPPGGFLLFGNTPLSLTEGMPLANTCKLTTAVARVSETINDGSSFDILKNGAIVYSLPITNGTKQAVVDNLAIDFVFNDVISVRASTTNVSMLNYPRITLLFRSS